MKIDFFCVCCDERLAIDGETLCMECSEQLLCLHDERDPGPDDKEFGSYAGRGNDVPY